MGGLNNAILEGFLLLGFTCWHHACWSLSTSHAPSSRRAFFKKANALVLTAGVPAAALVIPQQVTATESKLELTDLELKEVVKSDILLRQFLVTGNLTRNIYKPTATFTDEIDTYQMDQWIKGTQRLFVGEKSNVRLVGDVEVSREKVEFRFDEDLMFNIPFRPVVALTGLVVLTRDETGYITSYKEQWDQDPWSVIKSAKLN